MTETDWPRIVSACFAALSVFAAFMAFRETTRIARAKPLQTQVDELRARIDELESKGARP